MRLNVAALLGVCAAAAGCSAVEDRSDLGNEFSEVHSKQVEVRSEDGQSWALLTISSPNPGALDEYDADTIGFTPVQPGQDPFAHIAVDEVAMADGAGDEAPEDDIAIEVAEVHLPPGVDGYVIDLDRAIEPAIGWKNYYYYSHEDCAAVQRIKLIRRVYVSMWVKAVDASSSWDTKVTNRKLGNNETYERCFVGSYQLKVKVRTKKRKAFSIEFNE